MNVHEIQRRIEDVRKTATRIVARRQLATAPAPGRAGNCYMVAWHLAMGLTAERNCNGFSIRLCHGTVGAPDNRHDHAWVEVDDEWALDFSNGHDSVLPVAAYERVGNVADVIRYNATEVREHTLRLEHFGPWQ